MKYHVILLVLIAFVTTPYLVSDSFAICMINEDWPKAPCFAGKRGEDPSLNQMKQGWAPYYEFKGAEWMESKKQELMQTIQNGNLIDWKKGELDSSHYNVYMYYFLKGDIPNEDGLFAEEYYGIRFLSPLHQGESGVALNDIHCGIDLVLIQKHDSSPACVKLQSISKLIKRGWTETEFDKNEMVELFQNLPEAREFYAVYDNADMSVGDDRVSYFAGSEGGYLARMNMFFDENYALDHIDFHCYFQKTYQFELPQEDIASKLKKYDCREITKDYENQDATELSSYRDIRSSIQIDKNATILTAKELDKTLAELRQSGLPIVMSAIDYEKGVIAIWTPDNSNKEPFKEYLGNIPFVLLYEEAPPRLENGHPEPLPESSPEPEPMSDVEMQLYDARKLLKEAYQNHVNLGPYYMKDVIVGFGTYDDTLIIDIPSKYTDQNAIQVIKKEIRHLVGDNVKIDYAVYDEPIERHIATVIPYLWNKILHQNNIGFAPKEQDYWNHADGFAEHDKVCSPLVASNGTEFFISSTFNLEPFEITGTFIDQIKPDDCHKIWKTDVIMTEPDRVTALWLENED